MRAQLIAFVPFTTTGACPKHEPKGHRSGMKLQTKNVPSVAIASIGQPNLTRSLPVLFAKCSGARTSIAGSMA